MVFLPSAIHSFQFNFFSRRQKNTDLNHVIHKSRRQTYQSLQIWFLSFNFKSERKNSKKGKRELLKSHQQSRRQMPTADVNYKGWLFYKYWDWLQSIYFLSIFYQVTTNILCINLLYNKVSLKHILKIQE